MTATSLVPRAPQHEARAHHKNEDHTHKDHDEDVPESICQQDVRTRDESICKRHIEKKRHLFVNAGLGHKQKARNSSVS